MIKARHTFSLCSPPLLSFCTCQQVCSVLLTRSFLLPSLASVSLSWKTQSNCQLWTPRTGIAHLSAERSLFDGSPVDVIVLITVHLHFITWLSQMPHYGWYGFATELLANYLFPSLAVIRQAPSVESKREKEIGKERKKGNPVERGGVSEGRGSDFYKRQPFKSIFNKVATAP